MIPYSRQSINEDDIAVVSSILRSDWLTQGPKIMEFEEALCHQTGARHAVVVSNGTVALHLACLTLNIVPGDVGLTSPISFLASANCIAYCGGRPDFADIDQETLCLSAEEVEEYCENNTVPKVVIPVDFAGVPADLPRLKNLAEKYGFKLLEDASHGIGSTYKHNGKAYACGSCAHTDMAVFSFHPVKTITTGEGGAILTNDDYLAEKLRRLANHGVERDPKRFINRNMASDLQPSTSNHLRSANAWYYEMQSLGFNGRITDIQCALGISQLRRLEQFKTRRQEIVRKYNQAFKELEGRKIVFLPPWPEDSDPCYHLYPLRLGPNCGIHRDELFQGLREKGIYCQVHYIPIYRQPFYKDRYNYDISRFPAAEKYFSSCVSLPLYPEMDESIFQYVVETLMSIIQR